MKKERVLKSWLVKVLSWIFFVATAIDNVLENRVYDIVLIVWTALVISSFVLLNKYSNAFDYNK